MPANTLDAFVDKLMALAFPVLRSNCVVAMNVSRTAELTAGRRGSTVDVPQVGNLIVTDVTPAPVAADTQALDTDTYPIQVSNWREVAWTLTDKNVAEVSGNILPTIVSRGVEGLAGDITGTLYQLYDQIYGQAGTPGTIPFNDGTTQDARSARRLLDTQLCPTPTRWAALGPDGTDKATGIPNFSEVNRAGSDRTLVAGEIGQKFTISWFSENLPLPQHTAGSLQSGTIVKSGTPAAVDAKQCTVTGGVGGNSVWNKGDIVTFAGQTQQYVVTNDPNLTVAASSDGLLTFEPGLKVALVGDEAITVAGDGTTYEVQIGGHSEGVQLVSRRAADYDLNDLLGIDGEQAAVGNVEYMREYVDPVTNLILVVIITRQHRQYRMSISCMWGCGIPEPALCFRMAGA